MTHIKYLLNCKKFISLMILFSFFDNFGMQKTENTDLQNKDNGFNSIFDEEEESIHELKVLLLGDSGVGKTCIRLKLCDNSFDKDQQSTIGVDYQTKNFTIGNQTIKVMIWDSPGEEKFKLITQRFISRDKVFLLVYSVTDRESFNSLEGWLKEVTKVNTDAKFLLVGNKIDKQEERTVSTDEGRKFASEHNMEFVEVSAQEGNNIENGTLISLIKKFLDSQLLKNRSPFSRNGIENILDKKNTNSSFCDECCSCCPCLKKSEKLD